MNELGTINASFLIELLQQALDEYRIDQRISETHFKRRYEPRYLLFHINRADHQIARMIKLETTVALYMPKGTNVVKLSNLDAYSGFQKADRLKVKERLKDRMNIQYWLDDRTLMSVFNIQSSVIQHVSLPDEASTYAAGSEYHAVPPDTFKEGRANTFHFDTTRNHIWLNPTPSDKGYLVFNGEIAPHLLTQDKIKTVKPEDYLIYAPAEAEEWLRLEVLKRVLPYQLAKEEEMYERSMLAQRAFFASRQSGPTVSYSPVSEYHFT